MSANPFVRAVEWLRQGFPRDGRNCDCLAVVEVLHRHLTEEEVDGIVAELCQAGPQPVHLADVIAAIERRVRQRADEEDVIRVATRLAGAGSPVTRRIDLQEWDRADGPTD